MKMMTTRLNAPDIEWVTELRLLRGLTRSGERPNLLVTCRDATLEAVAQEVLQWCAGPVQMCELPGPLMLPPPDQCGTLCLKHVDKLGLEQQMALFDWLSVRERGMHVVSLATISLDRIVREGCFLEALFYRLNMVYLEAR
jgi:transcriptional regulator of acetoin/glycerol metabolism